VKAASVTRAALFAFFASLAFTDSKMLKASRKPCYPGCGIAGEWKRMDLHTPGEARLERKDSSIASFHEAICFVQGHSRKPMEWCPEQ